MNGSLAGKLLIALPTIKDPFFARSVILLCAHSEEHAMGIIINHAITDVTNEELFDQLGMDSTPAHTLAVLQGGPVNTERGFVLHSDDFDAPNATMPITSGISLTATEDVLLALTSPTPPLNAVLALGYAGWGEGQLEEEITENVWLIADASEALVYDKDYDTKWDRALASIGVSACNLQPQGGRA